MAVIIREGGKNPMEVKSWRDYVKLSCLEGLYDRDGQTYQDNVVLPLLCQSEADFIAARWGWRIASRDVTDILEECISEGLIERRPVPSVIKHGPSISVLVLTEAGRDLIPEHVFP